MNSSFKKLQKERQEKELKEMNQKLEEQEEEEEPTQHRNKNLFGAFGMDDSSSDEDSFERGIF